ncbi:hypothetical protein T06_9025 [Trichinella sp. T6]|nr:hypothetical protein T06_9025 [Trichinella sp. T6]
MSLWIAEIAESNHVYQVLSDALEAFQGFGNLEMTWFSSIVGCSNNVDFYAPLLTVGSCTPLLKGTTTVYKCT